MSIIQGFLICIYFPRAAASDYVNLDVVLQFTATLTTQCVNVTIVDDEEGETAEDFLARLEPDGFLPAGVTLSPDTASVTILDNEGNF